MTYAYVILIVAWVMAFVFSIIHHVARKWFLSSGGDNTLQQKPNWPQVAFFDLLFFSLLPGLVLVFSYPFMPLSGFRSGLALAVVGLLLGAGPAYLFLGMRKERSAAATVYDIFFHVCKMVVCFGLIGALFPP